MAMFRKMKIMSSESRQVPGNRRKGHVEIKGKGDQKKPLYYFPEVQRFFYVEKSAGGLF